MAKGIALAIAALLLLSAGVLASTPSKPEPVLPFENVQRRILAFDIAPPVPPGTDECHDEFSISNVQCSGDIRTYQQCIPTMSGNVWQYRTENCRNYGANWTCTNGDCRQVSIIPIPDDPETIGIAVLGFAIIGAAGYVLYRRWGK